MYGKKNFGKKAYKSKRLYKKRTAKTVTVATKNYVKREIHRNVENKVEVVNSANNYVASYFNNSSLFTVTCIPYTQILNDTLQGGRIGNVIKTRSCMMSYTLSPVGYDSVFNSVPKPQDVMVFFGKLKTSKPFAPVAADYAKLWQGGDTSLAPFSTPLDLCQSINKDYFTIYKIFRHKIGFAINTNSGSNVNAASYANNDYKYNIVNRCNATKWCPKTIKFNDGTNIPTNDGLYMWAMSSNADASSSLGNARPILFSYNLTFSYEDA